MGQGNAHVSGYVVCTDVDFVSQICAVVGRKPRLSGANDWSEREELQPSKGVRSTFRPTLDLTEEVCRVRTFWAVVICGGRKKGYLRVVIFAKRGRI